MRMGKCSIKEAFVRIENGEVIVYGMHVSPYEKGNIFNKDPLRPKKLLMHKSEIRKLMGKLCRAGLHAGSGGGISEGKPREGGDCTCQR